LQSKRDLEPVGNRVDVDPPTTKEVVRIAVVRMILAHNRTEDGRLKLSPIRARLLRDHLANYERQGILTPEDQQLLLALRRFTDGWARQERDAWRAFTFREARARRTLPVRSESRRPEPQSRESRPTRRVRTASATARGDPSSSSSSDDPHDQLAARLNRAIGGWSA
jgi:hypothetical protein